MSKTAIRSNLTVFNADVAVVKSKGMPYVLGYVIYIFVIDKNSSEPLSLVKRTVSPVMEHQV